MIKQLNEELKKAGFEVVDEGVRSLWTPSEENLLECVELGKRLAASLQ